MAVALFLTTKNVDATLFRRTTAWFHVKPGVGFAETHVPAAQPRRGGWDPRRAAGDPPAAAGARIPTIAAIRDRVGYCR